MSDITFVIGPIGSGKSRYSAGIVADALSDSERYVVTNLPCWVVEAPQGYLSWVDWSHKYVLGAAHAAERIRILTDRNEIQSFFMHYPGFDLQLQDYETKKINAKGITSGTVKLPDLGARQAGQQSGALRRGCVFVLDEVHEYFSARDWASHGPFVESYLSQCRKFGDDVYLVTQHPDKVDKNFRRNATRWIYLRNSNRQRLFGGVSFKDSFSFSQYPLEPVRGDQPDKNGRFRLEERELHLCYDTTGGAGLAGTRMPVKEKARGGHWWRWVALGCVILAGAWFLPRLAMYGIGRGVRSGMGAFGHGIGGLQNIHPPVSEPAEHRFVPAVIEPPKAPPAFGVDDGRRSSVVTSTNVIWVARFRRDGVLHVVLSDGRTFFEGDGLLRVVAPDWVVVANERFERHLPYQLSGRSK